MELKERVLKFIEYAENKNLPIEQLVVSDKNGVIVEHIFSKEPRLIRNIYSHTKAFTSTCIGILFSDKKIDLNSKIMDFFGEYREKINNKDLEKIKVKHLLNMSSGFDEALLMHEQRKVGVGYPDFVEFVLSHPLKNEPGSKFSYSNGDTYLLGKIVEKITQQTLQAFAYENILRPLEIEYPVWECDPQGCAFGASGLFISCKDMNKLGILYLNNGVINGKKILSDEWLNMTFTSQINPCGDEWGLGYSNQFWKNPFENSFRADGAWGQITHILKDQGLVISYQSPENGEPEKVRQEIFDNLLKYLIENKN